MLFVIWNNIRVSLFMSIFVFTNLKVIINIRLSIKAHILEEKPFNVINASSALAMQVIPEMAEDNLHTLDKYLLMLSKGKALS